MGTNYDVNVREYDDDVTTLGNNHYYLQVAKSVAGGGGSPTYNVVYAARQSAPHTDVVWKTTYGLNWISQVPDPGATVTCSGEWQECDLGQSYDLNINGIWSVHDKDPNAKKNAVNVGQNNYVSGVNIVVGIYDSAADLWSPVSAILEPQASTKTKTIIDLGQYGPIDRRCKWAVHTATVC
jgi:hypothetical protein